MDGDMRIGVLAMIVFLEMKGIKILCTLGELIELRLGLVNGSISDKDFLKWIIEHS